MHVKRLPAIIAAQLHMFLFYCIISPSYSSIFQLLFPAAKALPTSRLGQVPLMVFPRGACYALPTLQNALWQQRVFLVPAPAFSIVQPNGGNGLRSLLFCQPQSLVALMDMHVQIFLIDTHAQFVTAISMRVRCHSYLALSLISNCASWLSVFFLAAFCFPLSSAILII